MSDVDEILETAFMLTLGGDSEQIDKSIEYMVKNTKIHAAVWCPSKDGDDSGEWSISPIALGRVIACEVVDGLARVKFITVKGELSLI